MRVDNTGDTQGASGNLPSDGIISTAGLDALEGSLPTGGTQDDSLRGRVSSSPKIQMEKLNQLLSAALEAAEAVQQTEGDEGLDNQDRV